MADVVFDGSDGELKVKQIHAQSYTKFINKIELLIAELEGAEVWAARYLVDVESTPIKQKVLVTLNNRRTKRNEKKITKYAQ
jgi:hypothetical protein